MLYLLGSLAEEISPLRKLSEGLAPLEMRPKGGFYPLKGENGTYLKINSSCLHVAEGGN